MEPYTDGLISLPTRLTSLAYPLTDLMLVTMAVRLLAGAGRRGASFDFLTGGLILLGVSDSALGWLTLHGVLYTPGSPIEVGWLTYYLTVGACALHPSMRVVAEGVEDVDQVSGLRRAGCDLIQGYIVARPQGPAGVEALLALSATGYEEEPTSLATRVWPLPSLPLAG